MLIHTNYCSIVKSNRLQSVELLNAYTTSFFFRILITILIITVFGRNGEMIHALRHWTARSKSTYWMKGATLHFNRIFHLGFCHSFCMLYVHIRISLSIIYYLFDLLIFTPVILLDFLAWQLRWSVISNNYTHHTMLLWKFCLEICISICHS